MATEPERLFSDLIGALRPKGDRWRGCLMGDFNGNVDAPIDGWKYVRIPIAGTGDYALGMFPSGGAGGTEYNTPVLIEYDPINHQRIIAGADAQAIGSTIGGPTIPDPGGFTLPAHAWTHQKGGNDQLVISREQLDNLQISPSTTARHVTVSGGVCVIDGVLVKVYLPIDVDLTAYYPATGVKYVWLTLTAAGAVAVVDPAVTDITALAWPSTNNHVLGFVMLKALLTTIGWGAIKSVFDVIKGVTSHLPAATAQYQVITSGANPYPAAWSTFYVRGTAGGTTVFEVANTKTLYLQAADDAILNIVGNIHLSGGGPTSSLVLPNKIITITATADSTLALAITAAKTLTLTSTDDFNLTIPKTGTAVTGTGTAGRVAAWVTDSNTIQAAALIAPAANVLTLTATAASTLAAAISAGKTLTLTATDDYNLTIPESMIAAGRNVANTFTTDNTIQGGLNLGTASAAPAGDLYQEGTLYQFTRYGGNPGILARRANGAKGAETQVLSGQTLFSHGVRPWYSDTSAFSATTQALMQFVAAENMDSTHRGTRVEVYTAATGNNNQALAATFGNDKSLTVVGAFGCNGTAAQAAYASGGALAAYGAGANGLDTGANMSALHAMVVKIRAALVANGIMS